MVADVISKCMTLRCDGRRSIKMYDVTVQRSQMQEVMKLMRLQGSPLTLQQIAICRASIKRILAGLPRPILRCVCMCMCVHVGAEDE